MNGIPKQVEEKIRTWGRGRIFFIDDFAEMESPGTVRLTLMDLVKDGIIVRLARGIYCYPRITGEYGMKMSLPEADTIAHALATRERIRIIPYGDQSAYNLGLIGIRISDLKYLTDGAPRRICLANNRKIFFNHTSEVKMFDYSSMKMQMICTAVRFLGKDEIDERRRRILREHLRGVSENEFRKDISIPPAWVGEIIIDIWNS